MHSLPTELKTDPKVREDARKSRQRQLMLRARAGRKRRNPPGELSTGLPTDREEVAKLLTPERPLSADIPRRADFDTREAPPRDTQITASTANQRNRMLGVNPMNSPFSDAQFRGQQLMGAIGFGAAAGLATTGGGAMAVARFGEKVGPLVARTLGQAGGSMTVEGLRQAFSGEFSSSMLATAGLMGGIPGSATMATTRLGGRGGGIAPILQEAVAKRTLTPFDLVRKGKGLRSTFFSPGPRTEQALVAGRSGAFERVIKNLRVAMPRLRQHLSKERIRKVELMKQADASGVMIPVDDIIDVFERSKIGTTGAFDTISTEFATFNKAMDNAIEVLRKGSKGRAINNRIVRGVTPSELDQLITEQLSQKAFGSSGQVSSTMTGAAFNQARQVAQKRLLDSLPEEVSKLNQVIAERMHLMQRAEDIFGRAGNKEARESLIANMFKKDNSESIRMMAFIDESLGTNFVDDALSLGIERAFTPDPREAMGGGFFQQTIGAVGRGTAKTFGPFQALTNPATAFYDQFVRSMARGRRKAEEAEALEQAIRQQELKERQDAAEKSSL